MKIHLLAAALVAGLMNVAGAADNGNRTVAYEEASSEVASLRAEIESLRQEVESGVTSGYEAPAYGGGACCDGCLSASADSPFAASFSW